MQKCKDLENHEQLLFFKKIFSGMKNHPLVRFLFDLLKKIKQNPGRCLKKLIRIFVKLLLLRSVRVLQLGVRFVPLINFLPSCKN